MDAGSPGPNCFKEQLSGWSPRSSRRLTPSRRHRMSKAAAGTAWQAVELPVALSAGRRGFEPRDGLGRLAHRHLVVGAGCGVHEDQRCGACGLVLHLRLGREAEVARRNRRGGGRAKPSRRARRSTCRRASDARGACPFQRRRLRCEVRERERERELERGGSSERDRETKVGLPEDMRTWRLAWRTAAACPA